MGLKQRRRHSQRVVEVSQGGIREFGAGVEHALSGDFDRLALVGRDFLRPALLHPYELEKDDCRRKLRFITGS